MTDPVISPDLLRGNTDTMILKILGEDDHYGYEIVKILKTRSHGALELKEATLYSSLRRLETDGDIEWHWGDETQGGRRKYYRITDQGRHTYTTNKANWEHTKAIVDLLI
ncbi:MAG: PadR family transcriptional regulator [Propionibacteriaceae bacterium]|nr:PadR family transcriptional regulator [Propionibacteriaceae bacterium]